MPPAGLSAAIERMVADSVPNSQAPPFAPATAESMAQPTRVRFWGVRGSIPSPGRDTAFYGGNTTCVEVRTGGELIILDAGTGIRPLGLKLEEELQDRPLQATLLLTTMHWHHIPRGPCFRPAYLTRNQLRVLRLQGASPGLHSRLPTTLESPVFPAHAR